MLKLYLFDKAFQIYLLSLDYQWIVLHILNIALTSARFCARARRRFSPQNRALGLSVFGNHIVVAKLVEAARAKLFSHRTARIERFENYPFMTDDHKSSFMITLFTFAKFYLFL